MAYRTFMFLPKGNCCDINAIKDYLDPFCSNKKKIDFALSTLEEFDSKSVVKEITEILQDKAKCFDSYPPANFRQVPMVKTVTSYDRAQEVLPSLFSIGEEAAIEFARRFCRSGTIGKTSGIFAMCMKQSAQAR